MRSLFTAALIAGLAMPVVAAGQSPKIGILPFDTVSIEGGGESASAALAKLVRIEMIKAHKVTPELIELPSGAKTPVEPDQAAALGKTAGVKLVIVGTVTNADMSSSSHGANTGGLLSSVGVGGSINRSTATIGLHIELVDPAKGDIVDTFEVEGTGSQTGVGMDLSTALGGFNSGGSDWSNTSIGKAVQEAAKKLSDEVAKRAAKMK
jgi:curli biogenesis system outer membrane secretion channel CsgG